MASKIVEKDLGWKKTVENIKGLGAKAIKVGILSSAGNHKDGTSIAQIAAVHEYGYPEGNIPERSFIRAGIDGGRSKIAEVIERSTGLVIDGKMTAAQALGLTGTTAKALIQQRITSGPFEPNKPATIKAKRSSRPLIDTARLRASVDYEIVPEDSATSGGES